MIFIKINFGFLKIEKSLLRSIYLLLIKQSFQPKHFKKHNKMPFSFVFKWNLPKTT